MEPEIKNKKQNFQSAEPEMIINPRKHGLTAFDIRMRTVARRETSPSQISVRSKKKSQN